jgi:hypothetical protein
MSIILPFFNYNPKLYKEVLQAGILFSEYSILRLMCLKEMPVSGTQQLALRNFESWTEEFIYNSNVAFYAGVDTDINLFSIDYYDLMLNCLLTATLYDFMKFSVFESLNSNSFIFWKEGRLVNERPLSLLL